MSRLFLSTTADKARALVERRLDLLDDPQSMIVLTDRPLDGREGVSGDIICAVELRAGRSIARYEDRSVDRPHREWHLPVPELLRIVKRIQLV